MSQNKTKFTVNPISGEPQLINDLEMGWTVKNIPKSAFTVAAGYTRVYPNLSIPDGMTITVADGGELIVL